MDAASAPVISDVTAQLEQVNGILIKAMTSPRASTLEVWVKAVKSLHKRKAVTELDLAIDRYISSLTAYQTTWNGTQIKSLVDAFGRTSIQKTKTSPARTPCFLVPHQTDGDDAFIGHQKIMHEIDQRLSIKNPTVLAGISEVGYVVRYIQLRTASLITAIGNPG